MSVLNCKRCHSSCFHKSGHTGGMQRYKCKDCGCQFTDSRRRGVDPALKALAIVLYAYCGLSMSKIARLCQVSVVSVLKWVKQAARQVKPLTGVSSSDVIMMDEMWHFVNGKKQALALARRGQGHASTSGMAVWSSWGFNLKQASQQTKHKNMCFLNR